MADKIASVEIQAKAAGLAAQLREARAKFGQFADDVEKLFDASGKKARKKAGFFDKKGAGGIAGGALAVAGGNLLSSAVGKTTDYLEDAAKSAFTFQDKLVRLQINANATPEAMQAFSQSVTAASQETGKNKEEIIDAAASYVAFTGDMDTAAKSIKTWTQVAQATNSTVADVSSAAASLHVNMGVASGDMLEVLGSLASQGKKGAIEMKDLAGQLNNIAPLWASFGGDDSVTKAKKLGAALQIAKRGFGGEASETVTGLQGMLVAFEKHADKFAEFGVHVTKTGKGGKKEMRDVFDIVQQISKSKLANDPTALMKVFGRIEGFRGSAELSKAFSELKDFSQIDDGAKMIQQDLDTYMASAAGRTQKAFNDLKNTIAETFTPERIKEFASAVEDVVSKLKDTWHYFTGPTKEEHKNLSTLVLTEMQNDKGEGAAVAHANQILAATSEKDFIENARDNMGPFGQTQLRELNDAGGFKELQDAARQYLNSLTSKGGYVSHSGNAYGAVAEQAMYNNPVFNKGLNQKQLAETIANALVEGFAKLELNMDGSKVAKGTKQSADHRRSVKH